MNPDNNRCILLFAKSPVKGRVKTRLAAELGEEFAVALYKCFVEDVLGLVKDVGVSLRLLFHPPDAKSDFRDWLGEREFFRPQAGDDIGERMKNAFENAFTEGFSKVVAIGSDLPDLPDDFLRRAFAQLESSDAVLGPSSDGGYYLIGFSRESFLPETFENIAWSRDGVFEQTLCVLKRHGRTTSLLPVWHDVDTAADLKALLLRSRNTPFEKSRTYRCLTRNGSRSQPDVRL
jgi:uncharacterized protein